MVFYFAYGSNMNQADLDDYCRRNARPLIDLKSRSPKVCFLVDYRLDFNYNSSRRRSGAANIEPSPGEHVEGVLFEINSDDRRTIDQKEGAPTYYHEISVSVTLNDGTKIDNVKTYTVCENKKRREFTPPSREYKQIILSGAKAFGLSNQWIEKLEKIPLNA